MTTADETRLRDFPHRPGCTSTTVGARFFFEQQPGGVGVVELGVRMECRACGNVVGIAAKVPTAQIGYGATMEG